MWVLIWIVSIFVGTIIGSNKGAGWAGFIICLLLGPLGVVIVLVLRGDYQCPFCKKDIEKDAVRCPHCQADLSKNAEAGQESDRWTIDDETKKCPACAETIKLEAIKCRFCGHDFDPVSVAVDVEAKRKEWESLEVVQEQVICLGCKKIGPRSRMVYVPGLSAYYHKGCIPR